MPCQLEGLTTISTGVRRKEGYGKDADWPKMLKKDTDEC